MTVERDISPCIERIDAVLRDVEGISDPAVRGQVQELVGCLLDYHAAALARLLQVVREQAPANSLAKSLAADGLVASLLLLHGLHPADLPTRVAQALDSARPYLESHGGNVLLLGIDDGVVHLRLQGSCHGCPSSAATLKTRIERAIVEAAPDVTAVVVDGLESAAPPPVANFVPLTQLSAS
jgi:Fe-S cluster biogenesis protein NfuA